MGFAATHLRGGSWNNNHDNARAVYRNHNNPNNRNNDTGFRVVVLCGPTPPSLFIECLNGLRLTIHEPEAQVTQCRYGIPWLGFVVYPTHRRVKGRNVVKFSRRMKNRWAEYCAGEITFAEFDASVKGWVNHVRYADTWGLRTHVLGKGLVYRRPCGTKIG